MERITAWPSTDNNNDSIVFNFAGNTNTVGANVIIRAGYLGFERNRVTGMANTSLFDSGADQGKGFGGNITFDYMKVTMADGNKTLGGYMEISTPNGNIWGKDSINYIGKYGDLLVDAGLGSRDDGRAIRWDTLCPGGAERTLNTNLARTCDNNPEWRTGNIMMKGASLDFQDGTGNATFRTREGYIDTYDAFTADNMEGHLLKYAAMTDGISENQWGDVSERDFRYTPTRRSGSVFFGADDNIMLNYGYSNNTEAAYGGRGAYNIATATTPLTNGFNPYYSTSYMPNIGNRSVFDINMNGYFWYHNEPWSYTYSNGSNLHRLYRGCKIDGRCSPFTGVCVTSNNGARDLIFDFEKDPTGNDVLSGGLATVAANYIDVFTKFEYKGGTGSGLHSVPGLSALHGENVQGYGLFMKSQFTGVPTEKRRATCEGCEEQSVFSIEGQSSEATYEWTYIGFHDDARIHTHNQKSLVEAPVVEFFGHAELDAASNHGGNTDLTVKADSLIFHDSVVFNGINLTLLPYTTGAQRQNDMRYGVINDKGESAKYYGMYGPAIQMADRNTPVLEIGYQRCTPPLEVGHAAPNRRSLAGLERTPTVGGDVIVSFKNGFELPIYNTVVANHARISFITDSLDSQRGGEFVDSYIRCDLLRIRNKVEFYTSPGLDAKNRTGKLELVPYESIESVDFSGMYPHHLHMEPGSELSLPGENSLTVEPTTTIGGYGTMHEDIHVVAEGILAPGYASLMESDCQTPHRQGTLTIHNLRLEKDAIFRVSLGNKNLMTNPNGTQYWATLTDKLVVEDTIEIFGRIPVIVLPEEDYLREGCYTIIEYGDTLGLTSDYVKNLYLPEGRFRDYFFALDFSERGKVKICVSTSIDPGIQRFIQIPLVDGVTTIPAAGTHYGRSDMNFTFRASFSKDVLAVKAQGYITNNWSDLDEMRLQLDEKWFLYTIPRVLEPYVVYIGPELTNYPYVGNVPLDGKKIWTYKNTLYINVDIEDIVSIYNLTGILYKKLEIQAGLNKFTLDAGIYVVTLKDGTRHKIIIK